jgi:pimeloyl-ACP methyl ester carboxylesterase
MTTDLRFVTLSSGLRLGVYETGPSTGAPVLLLHGFPEFHWSWRMQWPALAAAGYRVIVPDQRGYNLSDKRGPFDLDSLTRDIAELLDALGIQRCHLVGHDWGGVLSYAFAASYPDRVATLSILNAPHPDAYVQALKRSREQRKRGWYVFYFQIPWLPERNLARDGFAFADRLFARAGSTTSADIARYKAALAQPGALRAMIGWYRAIFWRALTRGLSAGVGPVRHRALVIWGEKDLALSQEVNAALSRYAPNARIVPLPDASHWVQLDAPDAVNALLLDQFASALS